MRLKKNRIENISTESSEAKIKELNLKLHNGFSKYNLTTIMQLMLKIKDIEHQLSVYKRNSNNKNELHLNALKKQILELQNLRQTHDRLQSEIKIKQLNDELVANLAKFHIKNAENLIAKIKSLELSIKQMKKRGNDIGKVIPKLLNLSSIKRIHERLSLEIKIMKLKENLNYELNKLNIKTIENLKIKIKNTKEIIDILKRQENNNEITINKMELQLNEFKELISIYNEICVKIKMNNNDEWKLKEFNDRLTYGLAKYNINTNEQLMIRIKNTKELIHVYNKQGEYDEAIKAKKQLNELDELRKCLKNRKLSIRNLFLQKYQYKPTK
jgi:hypothetical protein